MSTDPHPDTLNSARPEKPAPPHKTGIGIAATRAAVTVAKCRPAAKPDTRDKGLIRRLAGDDK